ncbi:hypothetical protein ABW20_dc0109783 [Dactylellina cionopaga]|nr:hypothetical protein ABW20_dc0109783 [Dactylellina cionopaga]
MRSYLIALLSLGLEVGLVSAQANLYGQCGGQGWTGPTTCVTGAVCVWLNAYHSQCLPASSFPTTTSAPAVEPTPPPGSLSIKTSCVNTTIQQDWFIGWCLTGSHGKRIQSSVYLGNKVISSNGDLTWGDVYPGYSYYCNSCYLQNTSELSCICPAGGKPLYRTTLNLEQHIANYNGFLLNDIAGPPTVPTRSKTGLFPSDVQWGYDPGDTSCFTNVSAETCAFLTWGPGCDGIVSGRNIVPQCYYDYFELDTGSSARTFESLVLTATDGAYKFQIYDNLECSGRPSATIIPSEYGQCVKFHKKLVAWSAIPQWNADL